jgi:hypothetical protein
MPPLHRPFGRAACALAIAAFALTVPASAQQAAPSAAAQPQASSQELYHVHFVKAAPGKLAELVTAYQESPVAEGEPGPPLVFRHMQGDDWDLMVLTPLGKDETLSPAAPSAEVQRWTERTRGLRSQHGDTFTAGPPWTDVRSKLMDASRPTGTAGSAEPSGAVYTVTTYRSLPGHRDQLAGVLGRIAALYPDRRTILQHVEGAPWEFVVISRYDSWSALGADEAAPAAALQKQGFASNDAISMELRQHVAEHRDTIARLATR